MPFWLQAEQKGSLRKPATQCQQLNPRSKELGVVKGVVKCLCKAVLQKECQFKQTTRRKKHYLPNICEQDRVGVQNAARFICQVAPSIALSPWPAALVPTYTPPSEAYLTPTEALALCVGLQEQLPKTC